MPRPSRLGLALAATVAASSLFVGGGVAFADPPAPKTPECEALVKDDAAVKTAQGKADADANDTAAKTALATAKSAAETKLCTGTAKSPDQSSQDPSEESPAPADSKRPPKDEGNQQGGDSQRGGKRDGREDGGPDDEKVCDDFMSQPEAQRWHDEHPDSGLDGDDDGKACESLKDVGGDRSKLPAKIDSKTLVNQADDDDSEAKVSGSQVKDVPEGSVDTGSAQ